MHLIDKIRVPICNTVTFLFTLYVTDGSRRDTHYRIRTSKIPPNFSFKFGTINSTVLDVRSNSVLYPVHFFFVLFDRYSPL